MSFSSICKSRDKQDFNSYFPSVEDKVGTDRIHTMKETYDIEKQKTERFYGSLVRASSKKEQTRFNLYGGVRKAESDTVSYCSHAESVLFEDEGRRSLHNLVDCPIPILRAAASSIPRMREKFVDDKREDGNQIDLDERAPISNNKRRKDRRKTKKQSSLRTRQKSSRENGERLSSPQHTVQAQTVNVATTAPSISDKEEKTLSLKQIGTAVFLHFCLGVVLYSFVIEKWSVMDAIYFSMVTFCTVGYGDLLPSSKLSKVITSCYAVVGIFLVGIILGNVGEEILKKQEEAMKDASNKAGTKVFDVFSGVEEAEEEEKELTGSSVVSKAVVNNFTCILFIVECAIFVGFHEGWSFTECLYYFTMTSTTTGYGDFVPTLLSTKIFSLIFLPLSVALMGNMLSSIGDGFMLIDAQKKEKELLNMDFFKCFEEIDEDGDGEVTKVEFLSFMLVSMNKVNRETLTRIMHLFDKLDDNGNGVLDRGDFKDVIDKAQKKIEREKVVGRTSSIRNVS